MGFVRDTAPASLAFTPGAAPAVLDFTVSAAPAAFSFTGDADMADLGSATGGVAITPHATNAISPVPRAIHVGTAGDLVCRFKDSGADVTLKVAAGTCLPYRLQYVRDTSTAAALVALY